MKMKTRLFSLMAMTLLLLTTMMASVHAMSYDTEQTDGKRGSAMRFGMDARLRQRMTSLRQAGKGEVGDGFNEKETSAFEDGYRAAMEDVTSVFGTGIACIVFLIVGCSRRCYGMLRSVVRPWAMSRVDKGRDTVISIQKWSHPVLDTIHIYASNTCGVNFYISFLPLLFWSGECHLARQATAL